MNGWNQRVVSALETMADALAGTGSPIPLALADPAGDGWSAALDPNPIDRACGRIRIIVGNSGVIVSLDGGATESISLPPNFADDLAVSIPAGCDLRVKRYTAGTAMTELVVEVR